MNEYKFRKAIAEAFDEDVVELAKIALGEHNRYEDWQIITPDFDEYCLMVYGEEGPEPSEVVYQTQGEDMSGTELFRMDGRGNLECTSYSELADEARDDMTTLMNACEDLPGRELYSLDDDIREAIEEDDPINEMSQVEMTVKDMGEVHQTLWPSEHHKFEITLENNSAEITVDYYCNPTYVPVTKLDVLQSLFCDKESYESYPNIDEFAKEYGFATNVSECIKAYNGCKESGEKLEDLFGSCDYIGEFIRDVENGEYDEFGLDFEKLENEIESQGLNKLEVNKGTIAKKESEQSNKTPKSQEEMK